MKGMLRRSAKFLNKNGSTILTCIGAFGMVATTVMAIKATPKAIALIENAKEEKGDDLTKFETIKTACPVYLPTIAIGTVSIVSIFSANILNKKKQAALISAYAALDQTHKNYKKKVSDVYGEDANHKVLEELAKDEYKKEDIPDEDDGKLLYYDNYSNQYFRATSEEVLNAQYNINRVLAEDSYMTVNEYLHYMGLKPTDHGHEIGWSVSQMYDMYWTGWFEFCHEKVIMDDGLECTIIYITDPTSDFNEY